MNRYIPIVLALLMVLFAAPSVHAAIAPPIIGGTSTNGSALSILNEFNIGTSYIPAFAGLFALLVFAVLNRVLQRTEVLSEGSVAISLIIAAISFLAMYSNPQIIQFLLNVYVLAGFIGFLLFIVFTKGARVFRAYCGLLLVFTVYLLLANYPGISTPISNSLHINILDVMAVILFATLVLTAVYILIRIFARTKNFVLRTVLLVFMIFLLSMFIPGFAFFIFSPFGLVIVILVVVVLLFIRRLFTSGQYPQPMTNVEAVETPTESHSIFGGRKQEKMAKRVAGNYNTGAQAYAKGMGSAKGGKRGFFGGPKALPPPKQQASLPAPEKQLALPSPQDMEKMHPGLLKKYGFNKAGRKLGKRQFVTVSKDVINPETGEHKTLFPRRNKKH